MRMDFSSYWWITVLIFSLYHSPLLSSDMTMVNTSNCFSQVGYETPPDMLDRIILYKDESLPIPLGSQNQGATLFLGSSSFDLWRNASTGGSLQVGLSEIFEEIGAINRGVSGAKICDLNLNIQALISKIKITRVVFYAGENDIASGWRPELISKDFENFLVLKRLLIGEKTPVFFVSVKPSPLRSDQFDRQSRLNSYIEKLSIDNKDLIYVDVVQGMLASPYGFKKLFKEDGLHMNQLGYDIWIAKIKNAFSVSK